MTNGFFKSYIGGKKLIAHHRAFKAVGGSSSINNTNRMIYIMVFFIGVGRLTKTIYHIGTGKTIGGFKTDRQV